MALDDMKAIAAMVVELVQPVYTTLDAQLSATLLLGTELRRVADALERYAPVPGALLVSEPPDPQTGAEGELGCLHHVERRITFASSGNDDFYCQDCQVMVLQALTAKG